MTAGKAAPRARSNTEQSTLATDAGMIDGAGRELSSGRENGREDSLGRWPRHRFDDSGTATPFEVQSSQRPSRKTESSTTGSWRIRAACQRWQHIDWIDPSAEEAQRCRDICAGCTVKGACIEAALTAGEPWGIWGGLDPGERATLAEQRGIAFRPRSIAPHGTNPRYAKHGCRCDACRSAHTTYERSRLRRRKT